MPPHGDGDDGPHPGLMREEEVGPKVVEMARGCPIGPDKGDPDLLAGAPLRSGLVTESDVWVSVARV